MSKWYLENGKDNDVVLYSRVKVYRNLADTPFKNRMSSDIKKGVVKKLYATVINSEYANELKLVDLSTKSNIEAISYAERQLISPNFAKEKGSFVVNESESLSVMFCEEDHIRITSFEPGLNIEEAYTNADKLDNVFLSSQKIAFDKKLGFLTANPINLGTGLKISVGLHLPAIKSHNGISRLVSMVGKLGLSLRPLYSDKGAFYILTNQVSLGISEQNAIENVNAIVSQIIIQERNLRDTMKNSEYWEDSLFRSMGTLKMARRISFQEFIELISDVRLGVALGYYDIDTSLIGQLIHSLADGCVLVRAKCEESPELSSKIRAEILREKLS